MKEKIFLALSDKSLTKIVTEHLIKLGYSVESVFDGNEVIAKMKAGKPDLLLIDTVLPNKSGYDVLNEKSFDREVTKIPVIIISNAGEPIQMRQIPSTPVIKDYIIKTHVDPNEVVDKIELAFGRKSTSKDKNTVPTVEKKGKKILWVEDDKLLGSILSKKIESSGYTLLKATDGDQALAFLEKEVPDIIILDISLPGMNGLDILQQIKMDEKERKVPVLILSNLNRQSDIEKAKLLGADKFIVKAAVSLDEIVFEVETLIKNHT